MRNAAVVGAPEYDYPFDREYDAAVFAARAEGDSNRRRRQQRRREAIALIRRDRWELQQKVLAETRRKKRLLQEACDWQVEERERFHAALHAEMATQRPRGEARSRFLAVHGERLIRGGELQTYASRILKCTPETLKSHRAKWGRM